MPKLPIIFAKHWTEVVKEPIVEEILKDLTDRSGLDNAWDNIDFETQCEIIDKWESIVYKWIPYVSV